MRRLLALPALLVVSLTLGGCDSSDTPLAPGQEVPSPAKAKGLPGNGVVYRGWPTLRSVTPDGVPAFTFPEAGVTPVFSPDGTKLVYTNLASQTVHVLELNGQKITEILDVNWDIGGLSWSR